jgi:hypothetical protein
MITSRIILWGLAHEEKTDCEGVTRVSENLWVFPCGAYIESETRPKECPLCAKGVKHEDVKIDENH